MQPKHRYCIINTNGTLSRKHKSSTGWHLLLDSLRLAVLVGIRYRVLGSVAALVGARVVVRLRRGSVHLEELVVHYGLDSGVSVVLHHVRRRHRVHALSLRVVVAVHVALLSVEPEHKTEKR